jgi:hypothetical protein
MLDQPALYALLAFGGWPRKKRKAAEEQRIWNNSKAQSPISTKAVNSM